MEQRTVERLGRDLSVVGLGTWQLGAEWGTVTPDDARELKELVDPGTTLAQFSLRWIIDQRGSPR
jgi:aryl-alcohol dehydrogenase-like predicted oxidoreductase